MKRKYLSLIALGVFLLAGCNRENESTSEPNSNSENASETIVYPETVLSATASKKEIEVGSTTMIRTTVSSAATTPDARCEFTTSDTSLISIEVNENETRATVTALAAGKATITVTTKINPNVKQEVVVNIIATKPTLSEAISNIISNGEYAIMIGSYQVADGYLYTDNIVQAGENYIVRTDTDYQPVYTVSGKKTYGEVIGDGESYASYIQESNAGVIQNGAEVVKTSSGLLDASEIKGRKDKAAGIDEVGEFFGVEALNPAWFSSLEKNDDNSYEIIGDRSSETMLSENQDLAYAEATILRLINAEQYESSLSQSGVGFATSIASSYDTFAEVLASDSVLFYIDFGRGDYYGAKVVSLENNTEEYDPDILANNSALSEAINGVKGAAVTLESSLKAGVEAIETHEYIQKNSIYPDHKTECNYNTYYTTDYVFYDCDKEFRLKYDSYTDEKWTELPYGYVKKSDGIYRFELDDSTDTLQFTLSATKEDNTDSSTSLYEFAGYFSECSFLTNDLMYSFGESLEDLWSGDPKCHVSRSRDVCIDILEYFAPEDIPDYPFEQVVSGMRVDMTNSEVSSIYVTSGFCPFLDSGNDPQDDSYGVDRFVLSSFQNARTNDVNNYLVK